MEERQEPQRDDARNNASAHADGPSGPTPLQPVKGGAVTRDELAGSRVTEDTLRGLELAANPEDALRRLVSELRATLHDLRDDNARLRAELAQRDSNVVDLTAERSRRRR